MIARLFLLGTVASLGLSTLQAITFVPRQETQMIDTFPIRFLSFEDGARRVNYEPPAGWSVTGSATQLSLGDKKTSQAEATISSLPVEKAGSLDAARRQMLKEMALKMLPPEVKDPVVEESVAPHTIGNKEACTISMDYVFFAHQLKMRVIFVNLGTSYLKIVCTAPQNRFDDFARALDSSLFSWVWVPAS